jgi:hypothetical protein
LDEVLYQLCKFSEKFYGKEISSTEAKEISSAIKGIIDFLVAERGTAREKYCDNNRGPKGLHVQPNSDNLDLRIR